VKAAKLLKFKQDNLKGGKQEDKKESKMNKALHVRYDDAESEEDFDGEKDSKKVKRIKLLHSADMCCPQGWSTRLQ
jgi:hypothetical protein